MNGCRVPSNRGIWKRPTIAGKDMEAVARQLATIVKANAALTDHHKARRAMLTQ
jgi:hypothetical protein